MRRSLMFQGALPRLKQVSEEATKEVEKGVRDLVVTVSSMSEYSDLFMQNAANVLPGLAPAPRSSRGGAATPAPPSLDSAMLGLGGVLPSGLLLKGPSMDGQAVPSTSTTIPVAWTPNQEGLGLTAPAALQDLAAHTIAPLSGQEGRVLLPVSAGSFGLGFLHKGQDVGDDGLTLGDMMPAIESSQKGVHFAADAALIGSGQEGLGLKTVGETTAAHLTLWRGHPKVLLCLSSLLQRGLLRG